MSKKTCETCSVKLMDEQAFHAHLQSQKHLKRVQLAPKDLEDRSIFVSPLPQSVTATSIMEFFSKYGEIQNYRYRERYVVIEFKNK